MWSLVTLEPMATALLAENQASGSKLCERDAHPFDMAPKALPVAVFRAIQPGMLLCRPK
jgi:hypothetical protein